MGNEGADGMTVVGPVAVIIPGCDCIPGVKGSASTTPGLVYIEGTGICAGKTVVGPVGVTIPGVNCVPGVMGSTSIGFLLKLMEMGSPTPLFLAVAIGLKGSPA